VTIPLYHVDWNGSANHVIYSFVAAYSIIYFVAFVSVSITCILKVKKCSEVCLENRDNTFTTFLAEY
jgi:hypothetical protein